MRFFMMRRAGVLSSALAPGKTDRESSRINPLEILYLVNRGLGVKIPAVSLIIRLERMNDRKMIFRLLAGAAACYGRFRRRLSPRARISFRAS